MITNEPITSFDGPLFGFKKSRSRGKGEKLRQEKAKMRKTTKQGNVKNPHTKCGGFSGSIFTIKLGKIEVLTVFGPLIEVMATNNRRPPDYSSNLHPHKTFAI